MDFTASDYEVGSIVQHDDGCDYMVTLDLKGKHVWQLFKDKSDSEDELEIVQGFDDTSTRVTCISIKPKKPDTAAKKPIKHKANLVDVNDIVEKKPRGRPPKVLDKPKRTRPPTDYNIFVKEHLPKVNIDNPGLDKKAKMQLIGQLWKEYKDSKS